MQNRVLLLLRAVSEYAGDRILHGKQPGQNCCGSGEWGVLLQWEMDEQEIVGERVKKCVIL